MTVEKLKRYREWKSELEDISSKIDDVKVTDSTEGSQKDFPYILCNHKIEGVADEDSNLLVRKSTLKAQIEEIEDFVNTIPFYKVRKAVKLYYLAPVDESGNKYTWERIADILNDGTTENAIKKRVNRYLKENL